MFRYFVTVMYLLLYLMVTAQAGVIHVPGDQPTIQAGINAATGSDTVLVADGAYLENINFNGKAITVASHFLIDGDTSHISGTTITPPATANPDSNSVVYIRSGEDTTSVLCGFTISGGTGTVVAGGTARAGGGILVGNSSGARICHNIIENNTLNADRTSIGGGIGNGPPGSTAFIIIEHNRIQNNTITGTDFGGGGAMEIYCSGRITDNIITGNILNSSGDATTGGGARIFGSGSVTTIELARNVFANNKALSTANVVEGGIGGGLWIGSVNAQVYDNKFIGNEVSGVQRSYGGGVILHTMEQESEFYNNWLEDNYYSGAAPCRGGGMIIWRSANKIYNNIFKNNSGFLGGAIHVGNESVFRPELTNNTITGNTASIGAGLYAEIAQPVVLNSIFWANSSSGGGGEIFPGASLDVQYSDVQGGYPGAGNIDADPLFANSMLQLNPASPCIATADPAGAPPFDYGWNPRPNPAGSQPDMGAWESPHSGALHVPAQYTTIQAAIDAAADGNVVLVADGQYMENINFKGKAITIASHFLMDGDTTHISNTVIDGSQPSHPDSGSVVYFVSGEDTNSVLSGFTITNGTGTGNSSVPKAGGGIFIFNSGARISYNIIENNVVISEAATNTLGGGIFRGPAVGGPQSITIIEDNIIRFNSAEGRNRHVFGGGICLTSYGKIVRNQVINNEVIYSGTSTDWSCFGGGISCFNQQSFKTIDMRDNFITNNQSTSNNRAYGGGLDLIWTNSDFSNNIISNNSVNGTNGNFGAGMRFLRSDPVSIVKDNIFSFNTFTGAVCSGGGLLQVNTNGLTIQSNRFEGNVGSYGNGIRNSTATNTVITENEVIENSGEIGGGIDDYQSTGTLIARNKFIGNTVTTWGGAIQVYLSNPSIQNNLVAENTANQGGGLAIFSSTLGAQPMAGDPDEIAYTAIGEDFAENQVQQVPRTPQGSPSAMLNSGTEIINNTITANSATLGGGIYSENSNTVVMNTILWGDSALSGAEIEFSGGTMEVHYSDVQGGWSTGAGNIDADPLFADTLLSLLLNSPCLGAGIDSLQIAGMWYYAPPLDFAGNPRPMPTGTMPDMGAWEMDNPVGISSEHSGSVPENYMLKQNYPNPFNPGTTIEFSLPNSGFVTLKVYNTLGQEVATLVSEKLSAGSYKYNWDAQILASGVYFYRLQTKSGFIQTKKMLLLK